MKKAIAFLAIAAAVAFVASMGMASAALPETKTLWAGQNIDVGNATVSGDGAINITYATKDGWNLTAYHIYVSTTKPTKSAPGRFPFKGDVEPTTSITVSTIPVPDAGTTLYIAAQAELERDTGEVDDFGDPIYQYETGWADGEQIRPGKNWAMYFTVTMEEAP